MREVTYTAKFIPTELGTVGVSFPDVPGANTWGENRDHALDMAREVLELWLETLEDDGIPFPKASPIDSAEFNTDGAEYVKITAQLA
jgi:predicted RNase H-like HicB family nuclease